MQKVFLDSYINFLKSRSLTLYCNIFHYQLLDIQDGFLSLLDYTSGETKDDLKMPDDDVGQDIEKKFDSGESCEVSISFFLS